MSAITPRRVLVSASEILGLLLVAVAAFAWYLSSEIAANEQR